MARPELTSPFDSEQPVRIPITDEIDLHTFAPRECRQVLEAYFDACRVKGITQVRVIHGKGTGTLREHVHAYLRKTACVIGFCLCGEGGGGWGATRVTLQPLDKSQNF